MTDVQEPNKKLEMLSRLCLDIDTRNKLFSKENSQKLLQKLQLRDFPIQTILACPSFNLKESLLAYEYQYSKVTGRRDKRSIKVGAADQLDFLGRLLDLRDTNLNTLTIITGVTDFQKSRFISFLIVFFKLLGKVDEITNYKPLWHYVKGGFDDSLRDSDEYRSQKGNLNFLVLDGLSQNSSKLKLEKFNDITALYQNTNVSTDIIIIAAGFDPLRVAAEGLNTSFQAGLYLDEGLIVNL